VVIENKCVIEGAATTMTTVMA